MLISVSDAKAQLTDLVRRAEGGEEIVLTRHGAEVARIVPTPTRIRRSAAELKIILDEISKRASLVAIPGPSAARSQDFLYSDETGLPE